MLQFHAEREMNSMGKETEYYTLMRPHFLIGGMFYRLYGISRLDLSDKDFDR
jgi:hypothetical protein